MSGAPVTKSFPYFVTSLSPYLLCSISFPCHTSENTPVSPIIATDPKTPLSNPCVCHTSETPRGVHLVRTKSAHLGSVPFPRSRHRDEKPVTANPTKSAVTNGDSHKSFRIRFCENCRVTSFKPKILLFPRRALSLLFSLFAPRAFHNSLPLKGIRTLSKNSRVYGVSSHSGSHPRVQHPPFFSITSTMPILQLLSFDGLPSKGGTLPLPPYFVTSLLLYFLFSRPQGQKTTCPFSGLPTSIAGRGGVVL
jgi:hypothetical protein